MPIIFLFSAMVSGIALVMLVYMVVSCFRKKTIDLNVLDTIGKYLFFVLILDFTLEGLDQIHRIYEAEESFETLKLLVQGKLYLTLFISQGLIGTIIPLIMLAFLQFYKGQIRTKKNNVFTGECLDPDWCLFDEVECRYRRTAFLKELFRFYQLQGWAHRARRDTNGSFLAFIANRNTGIPFMAPSTLENGRGERIN